MEHQWIRALKSGVLAALLALSLAATSTAFAQEATPVVGEGEPTLPTQIHIGTCESLGDVAVPLDEATYGEALVAGDAATPRTALTDVVGSVSANPAAASVTLISRSLDELLDVEHAIDVQAGTEIGTRIVCGTVGGFRTGPDLVFGLNEVDNSNYGGVAWLHDTGDGSTVVTIFVAEGLSDAGGD
jgi:hypothetical protein